MYNMTHFGQINNFLVLVLFLGEAFNKIYVMKDTHPGIWKEMGRIRASEKREKEKPENLCCDAKYDRASRTLTVDGTIVDCYNSTFF